MACHDVSCTAQQYTDVVNVLLPSFHLIFWFYSWIEAQIKSNPTAKQSGLFVILELSSKYFGEIVQICTVVSCWKAKMSND